MPLDAAETARRLPYNDLVPAIALAARELTAGTLNAPERLALQITPRASLLCMPAAAPDIGITKIVTVHPDNRAADLPAIQGEMIVFDVHTGQCLLLLDGPTVTARRTGRGNTAGDRQVDAGASTDGAADRNGSTSRGTC